MTNPTDNQTPQPVDELESILDKLVSVSCDYEAGLNVDLDKEFEEAKARLLQWGTEQYKKGYIDGGIGVINE